MSDDEYGPEGRRKIRIAMFLLAIVFLCLWRFTPLFRI